MGIYSRTQEFRKALEVLPREDLLEIIRAQDPDLIKQINRIEWVFENKLSHLNWNDGTPVIDVDRGGRITWHGPGQLVGYPIVKLHKPTELVGFVREIESALIRVCEDLGIAALRVEGRSGVWIRDAKGDRKIAAIGIRVAKGVSMHGFALNVNPDLAAFSQIVPCGITDADVTSLEVELARPITIEEVAPLVERHVFESLKKVSA